MRGCYERGHGERRGRDGGRRGREGGRRGREGGREGDRERKRGKTRVLVLQHGAKLSTIQTPNLHTAPARAGDARTTHAMRVMSAGEGLARARRGGHRRGPRRACPAPRAPAHSRRARGGERSRSRSSGRSSRSERQRAGRHRDRQRVCVFQEANIIASHGQIPYTYLLEDLAMPEVMVPTDEICLISAGGSSPIKNPV